MQLNPRWRCQRSMSCTVTRWSGRVAEQWMMRRLAPLNPPEGGRFKGELAPSSSPKGGESGDGLLNSLSLSVSFSNIELFVNGCGRGIPCGCPNRDDRIFTGHPQEVPLRKSHTTLHPQRSRQSCQYSYHFAVHGAPDIFFLIHDVGKQTLPLTPPQGRGVDCPHTGDKRKRSMLTF